MPRETPSATTASRRVRVSAPDEFCTIQPLAPGSRIALFLFNISGGWPTRTKVPLVQAWGRISRDQGAFAAGNPRKGTNKKGPPPTNKPTPARGKNHPIKGCSPRPALEKGGINPPPTRQQGRGAS